MRILLIDDDAGYKHELALRLAESGFADAVLDHVGTAVEGERIIKRCDHDIYFVACHLPGAAGTDLIRSAREAGIERPIFCLTEADDKQSGLAAENSGATGHLSKWGCPASVFGRTIRYALRNAAAPKMPVDTERQFRLAAETATIGTWNWDTAQHTITWDACMNQFLGCPPETRDDARDRLRRALKPASFAAFEQAIDVSLVSGAAFQTDFDVTRDDGSVRYLRCAGRPIRTARGDIEQISGIAWDITPIRDLMAELAQARDAAQHANQAKSRFLAAMSHELRTPLNAILGYARLLRIEGGLNPAQGARVESMLTAGNHLLELMHGILDISAIETERFTLEMEPVKLADLASDCVELIRQMAEEKGLSVRLDLRPDVPPLVRTDPVKLRQILVNLLGNATKFTRRGEVALLIQNAPGATGADGIRLNFEVSDTGPGIPAERRHRMFKDFGRLQSGQRGKDEGAGLGLSLSHRLATLMGGKLEYSERPGGGSVFRLQLPLAACSPPTSEAVAPKLDATPPARQLHVLVVDDSPMNLDIAASFIRLAGHRASVVESGEAALEAAAREMFDVVMMDVRMPGMDGLEATRRIRALPGRHGTVPVVALTAQVFTEQLEACRRAGMSAHLAKPLREDALLAMLQHFAGSVQLAASNQPSADVLWSKADTGLPIIDQGIFSANTGMLKPSSVVAYLEEIAGRTARLLDALQGYETTSRVEGDLLETVHTLAGSIGLFGFARAADAARRFEHAMITGAPEPHACAETLSAVLQNSLPDIDGRLTEARRRCVAAE